MHALIQGVINYSYTDLVKLNCPTLQRVWPAAKEASFFVLIFFLSQWSVFLLVCDKPLYFCVLGRLGRVKTETKRVHPFFVCFVFCFVCLFACCVCVSLCVFFLLFLRNREGNTARYDPKI